MTSKLRLNLFLARAGVASRRQADELIRSGRVRLNGALVAELGVSVDPNRDRVEVDGQPVGRLEKLRHVVLHKPIGTVTTARDPEGRPTVLDALPKNLGRLYPVGRLDIDSSGLLFVMNDGRLAFRLMHPRYEVPKTYRVVTDNEVPWDLLQKLAAGVELEDGKTAPAKLVRVHGRRHTVDITIHEGRNRQVRRMFDTIGHRVQRLERVKFGPIALGSLAPGSWRELTHAELLALRRLVGLENG
jgi:23S rRNA pseudouridine2605 synthase